MLPKHTQRTEGKSCNLLDFHVRHRKLINFYTENPSWRVRLRASELKRIKLCI